MDAATRLPGNVTDDHSDEHVVGVGLLQVNVDRSEARFGSCILSLTWAQRCVLVVLLRHRGRIVHREALFHEAFGRPLGRDSRAADIHVGRIRRELNKHRAGVIITVDRVGYRIDIEELSENGRRGS